MFIGIDVAIYLTGPKPNRASVGAPEVVYKETRETSDEGGPD